MLEAISISGQHLSRHFRRALYSYLWIASGVSTSINLGFALPINSYSFLDE